MIKFDELTLGEIEQIELLLDRPIDEVFADGLPKGRALRVLYYVLKIREDADFEFTDTEKLTQTEALNFLTGDDSKKE